MLPTIAAAAAHYASSAPVGRETMRVSPVPESTKYVYAPLVDAMDKRIERMGQTAPIVDIRTHVPDDTLGAKYNAFANSNQYSSSELTEAGNYRVNINPNAAGDIFAHELGHVASQHTPYGKFLANTRNSPALRNSLGKAALMTLPAGVLSALMPGDGDIDESIALAALVAAPEILEEIDATRHGLGIMKDAGMPADRGQRARLAGAALSYMALPIALGTGANFFGNLVDANQQTPSTI